MLQSIDTLIAFVVIVLAASLLVTILVQMLSAAFALRGKNLGNALALTFQTIYPDIGKKAYALAERILSDPRLSDSSITRKRLDWSAPANQLRPWSWWSLFNGLQAASAIRPQEIYDLLKKIAGSAKPDESTAANIDAETTKDATGEELTTTRSTVTNTNAGIDENAIGKNAVPQNAGGMLTKNGTSKSRIGPRKNQLSTDALSKLATKLLEELGRPHGEIEEVNKEFFALRALADKVSTADEKKNIADAINKAQASFEAISADFKSEADALSKWFAAAQDRAQQWFQMHTRIFTIICGTVLAFLLQLDAAEIFKFVSTNATSRAALAASADKLVDRADSILEKNGSLLDRIYDSVKKKIPAIDLPKDVRDAAGNSAALKKAIQDDATNKPPADFTAKYDAAEKEAIDAYYNDRRAQMDDLTKGVAATGFDLLRAGCGIDGNLKTEQLGVTLCPICGEC